MGVLSPSPFRFQEKGNLEVLLFSIQSKLRACNRRLFVPREGCGIWDIDKVRLRMWRRGRVTPWGRIGCALLKGAIHAVDILDWILLRTAFRQESVMKEQCFLFLFFSSLHKGAVNARSHFRQRSQGH